jgi:hypothetical protein
MLTAVFHGLAAGLSLGLVGLLVIGPRRRPNQPLPVVLVVGLVVLLLLLVTAAALATALGSHLSGRWHALVVILALVTAAAGGTHVTTAVFDAIDERDQSDERDRSDERDQSDVRDHADEGERVEDVTPDPAGSLRSAGQVLRGGAWIGILERLAVFATLVARWPEGIAVVLAVKGLGRYPELRTGRRPGLAERFIIGTLVSVLWAGLCAYAATGPALG